MGLHGAEDHGEAQASPLTDLLGGEEGIQGFLQYLLGHSHARVFHDKLNPGAVEILGVQGENAALRHGVHSIEADVHEGMGEAAGITLDGVQLGFQIHLQAHLR